MSEHHDSPFFATLSRLRFVQRWALMPNHRQESVQEHALQAAQVAHALAVIQNEYYGDEFNPNRLDADRIAMQAIYRESRTVFMGDIPTPIKDFSRSLQKSLVDVEVKAEEHLIDQLPERMRPTFEQLIHRGKVPFEHMRIIKAANAICAYLKCVEEARGGNKEFANAQRDAERRIQAISETVPAAGKFMEWFAPSFERTLDAQMDTGPSEK